jgi:hypothetical protein
MKTYPSIPKDIRKDLSVYAFDKLDGSNIRAEFSRKKGFWKFGSRRVLINEDTEKLGEAVTLIKATFERDVTDIMKKSKLEKGVFFFEFYGENSFAGNHPVEEHRVTIIDVDIFKKGIMPPDVLIKTFGHLDLAKVLYHGKVNSQLIDSVRHGTLDGMTFEGVICKANNPKRTMRPIMFKIKNQAWLDKLKSFCGDDAELYRKLA